MRFGGISGQFSVGSLHPSEFKNPQLVKAFTLTN